MSIELHRHEIHVDGSFTLTVQRAERLDVPIEAARPSSLGILPIHRVAEHATLPARVRRRGGFFVPLGRHESFWLGLDAVRMHAVKVGLGRLDAISGSVWRTALSGGPRNYVVAPPPRAVFGVRSPDGSIRRFEFSEDPLRVVVFPLKRSVPEPSSPASPRPRFQHAFHPPDRAPAPEVPENDPSRFGPASWDARRSRRMTISMVDPDEYHAATGDTLEPPPGASERYVPRLLP